MGYGKKRLKEADAIEGQIKALGKDLLVEIGKQKGMLSKLEARRDELSKEIEALAHRVEARIAADGTLKAGDDPGFETLRERYFNAIAEMKTLDATLEMTEESIAEGETLRTHGIPTDDSVMGPKS